MVCASVSERKESFLNRPHLRNQFRAGERRTPDAGLAAEPMPEPKETAFERKSLSAEAFRGRRGGEVERSEHVPRDVRPHSTITVADHVFRQTSNRSLPRIPAKVAPRLSSVRQSRATWQCDRPQTCVPRTSRATRLLPLVRWPVSSALTTASWRKAASSSRYGAATAALVSSHAVLRTPQTDRNLERAVEGGVLSASLSSGRAAVA